MNEMTDKSFLRKAITTPASLQRSMPVPDVWVNDRYNDLLTPFGYSTLKDRYLLGDETPQDRFANTVRYYANDAEHAQRMYEYMAKLWCIGSTPVISNGGTTKGNLISCFLKTVEDSLEGIADSWNENVWLGSRGGGLGTFWGKVRSIGERAGVNGKTSGMMSFVKVSDSLVSCISQGTNRRASEAVFLHVSHPEIETFIDMRLEQGGDPTKKAPNLHHGVLLPDAFYEACEKDEMWDLISPLDGTVIETVSARRLMEKILTARMIKGEPYIVNIDTINKSIPLHHKKSGLLVTASNLCVEIVLPTGIDHHGRNRTAVCALFQLNLEKFEEWKDNELFLEDIAYFMDNVLQDFIDNAGEHFINARYSASRERSIGIGAMGFHRFLQSKNIPFDSAMAKVWNIKFFKHINEGLSKASVKLAEERGQCPDAAEHGIMERFSNKTAVAPTASVSIIAGTSPGIDPDAANIFTQKTLDGTFEVRNPYLEKLLKKLGQDTPEVWASIIDNLGSVQHLDFLSDHEKSVFKTSLEIDPRWYIEHAADRQPFIDQSQSLNLFVPPDIDKYDLLQLHMLAWRKGIKTLYYLRSVSTQRADSTTGISRNIISFKSETKINYDDCLACQ